jgi:hypothetical protein
VLEGAGSGGARDGGTSEREGGGERHESHGWPPGNEWLI